MSDLEIKVNYDGVGQLLHSGAMQSCLESLSSSAASMVGIPAERTEVNPVNAGTRVIVRVGR